MENPQENEEKLNTQDGDNPHNTYSNLEERDGEAQGQDEALAESAQRCTLLFICFCNGTPHAGMARPMRLEGLQIRHCLT